MATEKLTIRAWRRSAPRTVVSEHSRSNLSASALAVRERGCARDVPRTAARKSILSASLSRSLCASASSIVSQTISNGLQAEAATCFAIALQTDARRDTLRQGLKGSQIGRAHV